MFGQKKPVRSYLDWAAATPLSEAALSAMQPFLTTNFGNPGAIHEEGQVAKKAVEEARAKIATALQVRPEFITFTASGTEANNLAIVGLVRHLHQQGRAYSDMEIITTDIEHPSVSATLDYLSGLGVVIKKVPVDEVGEIKLNDLTELVNKRTVLVSVAYANSEIGIAQNVRAIGRAIKTQAKKLGNQIYFHVDAAQAPLWLNCQFEALGADLMTLDALKCCGPKGVGVLVHNRLVKLDPILFGGGQEDGLRPGTENVPVIVGAGVALSEAQSGWQKRSEAVSKIRDAAIEVILNQVPGAVLNGPTGDKRLANNINISIPGLDTEYATVVLDKHGFAASTKSACAGAGGGESKVVQAISSDQARAASTLRLTIGPETSLKELKKVSEILTEHAARMQKYAT